MGSILSKLRHLFLPPNPYRCALVSSELKLFVRVMTMDHMIALRRSPLTEPIFWRFMLTIMFFASHKRRISVRPLTPYYTTIRRYYIVYPSVWTAGMRANDCGWRVILSVNRRTQNMIIEGAQDWFNAPNEAMYISNWFTTFQPMWLRSSEDELDTAYIQHDLFL